MTKKVITASPSTRFSELVRLLIKKKISGLLIVNKRKKVIGVISEKDLFYKLFPTQEEFYKNLDYYMNYRNLEKDTKRILRLNASGFMTRDIISVRSDDNILTACSLMLIHDIRRLPVIDKGRLVGIVTTNNVYRNFLTSLIKTPPFKE